MDHRFDRRAALRMVAAAPLGVAGGLALAETALAERVLAQGSHAPVRARIASGPVEPSAGTWKTMLLRSGSELRLPAPPD